MKLKNKMELKKTLMHSFFVILFFLTAFTLLNFYQYKTYTRCFNKKIEAISARILEDYPKVSKLELMELLNSRESEQSNVFREYGIDPKKDSIMPENKAFLKIFLPLNAALLCLLSLVLLMIFLKYNHRKDKKLQEITQYIEKINQKNYKLDIDDNTEDELSILKNEIYKTTILLKEQAENSLSDKRALKDSLSDISHQLKTPLTSILIMLDNIMDNPDMEPEIRAEFITDMRKKITNINFLVQSLLKLSKFDANAITFHKKPVEIKMLIEEAMKNVSVLCDLKDIEMEVLGPTQNTILCDFKWQTEALTNLLKNSVEYSNPSSRIQIVHEKNKMYSKIEITDDGKGIAPEDIPHIFERFYKGRYAGKDSVGIGLALSKAIIEQDGGIVSVESVLGKGTRFEVRYFHHLF